MKINTAQLVKKHGSEIEFSFVEEISVEGSVFNDFELIGPVSCSGSLSNEGGILELEGQITGKGKVKCFRCLKELPYLFDIPLKEKLFKNEDPPVDEYTYEGYSIVLDSIISDYILLSLPMKQICEEGCRGLCPVCGRDLNQTACDCDFSVTSVPENSLAELKKVLGNMKQDAEE